MQPKFSKPDNTCKYYIYINCIEYLILKTSENMNISIQEYKIYTINMHKINEGDQTMSGGKIERRDGGWTKGVEMCHDLYRLLTGNVSIIYSI